MFIAISFTILNIINKCADSIFFTRVNFIKLNNICRIGKSI